MSEASIVTCDYLIKEAMEQFLDIADRHQTTLFILKSKPSILEYIRSSQELLDEVDPHFFKIKEAAHEWISDQPVLV